MGNAFSRVAPLFAVVLLGGAGPGFAAHDENTFVAGLCSIVPVATFRDASISYFVATANPDTVFAGPGQVRPSIEGGHWGPANPRAAFGTERDRLSSDGSAVVAMAIANADVVA